MDASEAARRSAGVAALFDRVAGTYENVGVPWFAPIGAALVRELAPAPGERVLDLGCGRGATLLPLADAVGPAGRVTGVDLAPGMIAHLAADVRDRGLSTVDLHVADAADPPLPPGSYELVASSLVLFFLPDPAAALRAWRKLLVPGGRLGVSTFGPRDPVWDHLDAVFRPYLPAQLLDARTSGVSGPFATDGGMEDLLSAAGFVEPRTVGVTVPVRFADAGRWEEWSRSHGQRQMWDCVPPAEQDAVLAEAAARLEAARGPDGDLVLTQQVRLTLGRTPA